VQDMAAERLEAGAASLGRHDAGAASVDARPRATAR